MVLIYLSPVRWDSIAQRPHFFVKTALQYGFESVIWIEPTASRLPKLSDFKTKVRTVEAKSFDKPINVHIVNTHFLPVEPLGNIYDIINATAIKHAVARVKQAIAGKRSVLAIGKPSRLARTLLRDVEFSETVFDVMDDYSHFSNGISAKNIAANFDAILTKVDRCFFSSNNLLRKYGHLAKASHLILNACDKSFYRASKSIDKAKNHTCKVFGYVGSIAQWFDWNVVSKLASENPNDRIVLVGPNYDVNMPKLPGNVEIRKAVAHAEIPSLMSSFDYGIIPFKVNELTESVDPVKYYEYVACDLTVISTRFGEMTWRIESGEVADFDNYKNFIHFGHDAPVLWDERFCEVIKDLLYGK